jgi:hypothetical protein
MDGGRTICVEFTEREAFAVLVGVAMARGVLKRDPVGFEGSIAGGALGELRPGVFVGPRQWAADSVCAGHKLWCALGLSEPPPSL